MSSSLPLTDSQRIENARAFRENFFISEIAVMKYRHLCASVLLAALCLLSSGHADAAWLSNPDVRFDGSCATELVLSMNLNGYNNYGAADGRADVLYSGEGGTWTFNDPCAGTDDVHVRLLVSLDDHYNIPIGSYELDVVVNGKTVVSGYADELGLQHGTPYGQRFGNWALLWIRVKPADRYQISVYNRSGLPSEHWIAIDEISVHLRE
jgi:hypothetical protein